MIRIISHPTEFSSDTFEVFGLGVNNWVDFYAIDKNRKVEIAWSLILSEFQVEPILGHFFCNEVMSKYAIDIIMNFYFATSRRLENGRNIKTKTMPGGIIALFQVPKLDDNTTTKQSNWLTNLKRSEIISFRSEFTCALFSTVTMNINTLAHFWL